MKYRSEIDGLRAIAVIPVIFFHAGVEQFSGGFVGVDVFFVISGYLITTIILSEKERGTFSLIKFYERRARRILPALFFMMMISLPFAWFWLMPSDMKDYSQSLIAVPTFSSNILFWRESGYWGPSNELKPLLHTWSLAVEEQYYILFPLFLIIMWKFRKRWILSSLIGIAVISLLVSQWAAYNKPIPNFFLLPTRGWELAVGACIAFCFLYRRQTVHALLTHKIISELGGIVGFLMIGYSVFVFDKTTPFPGFYALIPTMGTGLIILFSTSNTLVGRLLSAKYFVGIGLISYSAYLWHQPLIAFRRHATFIEASELALVTLAFASFPIAYLSWKFIETPFRSKTKFNRQQVFLYSFVSSLVFISIGVLGVITNGFIDRPAQGPLTLSSIEQKWKGNFGLSDACDGELTFSSDCRTSDEPEILIWGDSFAMHLVSGIISSNPDAKIIQMTKSSCGPFFDIAPVKESNQIRSSKECLEFTGKVHDWLKNNSTVKYAVVSSPFANYLLENGKLLFRNGDLFTANISLVTMEFEKTLNELLKMGINPIVFSPPPANGNNIGRCLVHAEWTGINLDECNFRVDEITDERTNVYKFLDLIATKYRVVRLDNMICDSSICKTYFDSTYIFRDAGHLSIEGSILLGNRYNFFKIITGS